MDSRSTPTSAVSKCLEQFQLPSVMQCCTETDISISVDQSPSPDVASSPPTNVKCPPTPHPGKGPKGCPK